MYQPFTQAYDVLEYAVCEFLYEIVQELRAVDYATWASFSRNNDATTTGEILRASSEIYILPGTISMRDCWVSAESWPARAAVQMILEINCPSANLYISLTLMDSQAELRLVHIGTHTILAGADCEMRQAQAIQAQLSRMRMNPNSTKGRDISSLIRRRWSRADHFRSQTPLDDQPNSDFLERQ